MLHSLSAQVSYYSKMIQSRSEWQYVGVYADEAATGTKDNRNEFQRMISDCRNGKIDLVITKSISRFARNTVTLLKTVRELKDLGVDVYFEEQNIHSMSGDGELMLTNIKIETDLTKYNSQGVKKYPMEIYIGNIHESQPKSTENTDSGYAQFNPETGHYEKTDGKTEPKQQSNNAETKPKSEFSYCLMSGIVQGVKLYSAPNNDSYVGTITSFSNDILDERGKKTKAVYISGGKNDGWYKRSDVGQLYVRNDDPCLPSGRYVAESMGID